MRNCAIIHPLHLELETAQLKENLRRSLDSAIARGNLNQVQYYNEVLDLPLISWTPG